MDEGVLVQWGTSTGGGKRWYLHGMGFKKTGNCTAHPIPTRFCFQDIIPHVIVVCVCEHVYLSQPVFAYRITNKYSK